MLHEHHHDTLRQALQHLPTYAPPSACWTSISVGLDAEQSIAAAVRELPSYSPPPAIWEQIENQLEQPTLVVVHTRRWTYYRAALAAAFALLLVAAWWLVRPAETPQQAVAQPALETPLAHTEQPENHNQQSTISNQQSTIVGRKPSTVSRTPSYTYSKQVADAALSAACQSTDEAPFELVEDLCRNAAPVCEQPEFKSLKTELDELTLAQQQLREALGQYADDPDLVRQLVELERERSALLQQLIALI